jgi:hypothetical protein
MRVKRPLLVTFIGDLNLISIFFITASFCPTPHFIEKFGFSFIPISNLLDGAIRILSVISLVVISYGFFKLKKYGYYLMIYYNLFFLALSMYCMVTNDKQLNLGSEFIPSLIALIITYPSKRYFIKEVETS